MKRHGVWFADIDREMKPPYIWQPCLADNKGCGEASLDVWFNSKEACDEYIAEFLIYAGHDK